MAFPFQKLIYKPLNLSKTPQTLYYRALPLALFLSPEWRSSSEVLWSVRERGSIDKLEWEAQSWAAAPPVRGASWGGVGVCLGTSLGRWYGHVRPWGKESTSRLPCVWDSLLKPLPPWPRNNRIKMEEWFFCCLADWLQFLVFVQEGRENKVGR